MGRLLEVALFHPRIRALLKSDARGFREVGDRAEVQQENRFVSRSRIVASVAYGSATGFLAGLVGLGGAEERIPFVLYYLKLPLEDMIVANLLISLATSAFNFAIRIHVGVWASDATAISLAMIVGSLPGAYAGASLSHKVSVRALKGFIAFVLTLVIARITLGLLVGVGPGQGLAFPLEMLLSLLAGFGVGIVSGSVGVAGGEYRIPILTYILGLPIKIAGTASQIVSLPTVLVSLWRHRRLGFFSMRSLQTALMLGVPSVVGAALSGFLVAGIPSSNIDIVFVLLLGYTVFRLAWEVVHD